MASTKLQEPSSASSRKDPSGDVAGGLDFWAPKGEIIYITETLESVNLS